MNMIHQINTNYIDYVPNMHVIKSPEKTVNIHDAINLFLTQYDVGKNSKNEYKNNINRFFEWVEETGRNIDSLTKTDMLEYKQSRIERGLASSTIGNYITGLTQFYKWAEANKLYPNITAGVKKPRKERSFKKEPLNVEQVNSLLTYFREQGNLRDIALVTLLLYTGVRTIEARRANIADLKFIDGKKVLTIHGKGRSEKDNFNFVVLTETPLQAIEAYLSERGATRQNEPLFISDSNNSRGKSITTTHISTMIKAGLRAIGINDKSYTAHSLRHTCGTSIMEAGGTIEQTQWSLRHIDSNTTQVYAENFKRKEKLHNSGVSLLENYYNPNKIESTMKTENEIRAAILEKDPEAEISIRKYKDNYNVTVKFITNTLYPLGLDIDVNYIDFEKKILEFWTK